MIIPSPSQTSYIIVIKGSYKLYINMCIRHVSNLNLSNLWIRFGDSCAQWTGPMDRAPLRRSRRYVTDEMLKTLASAMPKTLKELLFRQS